MTVRWAILVAVVGVLAALLTACGSTSNVQPYVAPTGSASARPTPGVAPTTSAAPTTTAPITTAPITTAPTTTAVARPSSAEIRVMTFCEALRRGKAAMGFIVYPNSAAKACATGAPGADVLRLCDAIYDSGTNALRATTDGRTSDPAIVSSCPLPTASATPVPPSAAADTDAAPVGSTRSGTWWQAAESASAGANLWFFDPAGSSGATREYRETSAVDQQSFVYQRSGTVVAMAFPAGARRTLQVLAYDPTSDTLSVQLDGATQQWVGCASPLMPAAARRTCP